MFVPFRNTPGAKTEKKKETKKVQPSNDVNERSFYTLLWSNKNEMAFKLLAKQFRINYIYYVPSKRTEIGAAFFGMRIRSSYVYYKPFYLPILLAVNQLRRRLLQIRFPVYSHPITRPASSFPVYSSWLTQHPTTENFWLHILHDLAFYLYLQLHHRQNYLH